MKIPFKFRILLWLINKDKGPQIYEMSGADARRTAAEKTQRLEKFLDYAPISLHKVFDMNIPGRDCEITVRIYQPTNEQNLPVIMYFHGGGFVISSVDTHDKLCRRIARDNKAHVISVEYRLAPEFKFPIPLQDCYDATVWAAQNASVHHGDTNRLVVMGDSAGGNLAAAVSLMSRDLNGPKICYQVLIYPCTDGTLSCDSIEENGKSYLLTKKMMEWFIAQYISKKEDLHSPYLSMLFAKDLTNLPPAFIFTAEYDPLKDEGRLYADRLKEAGNEVRFKEYGGMIHAFISMPKMSKHVLSAFVDIKKSLETAFA